MGRNKLKVVFVTSGLSELRGGPILLFNYATALNRYIEDVESEIVTFENKNAQTFNLSILKKQNDAPKISVHYVDIHKTMENKLSRSVLYTKTVLQDLSCVGRRALCTLHMRRGSGKYLPAIKHILPVASKIFDSFDVVYAGAWSSIYAIAYIMHKKRIENAKICALHALYHPSLHEHLLSKLLELFGCKYVIPKYDFVSCSTPFEANYLERFSQNVYFLPETVDDEYIKRQVSSDVNVDMATHPFTGIFIGAKSWWKGYYHTLIAFNLLAKEVGYDKIKLIIVGRDVLMDAPADIVGLAKKSYLELSSNNCIESYDFVSESTKIKAIAESDIVMIPSLAETISLVTIEGWFLGKPSVIANIPTAKSIVKYNGNGAFIVRFGDIKELTEVLCSLYRNKPLLEKTGKKGKLIAQSLFSMRNVAYRIDGMFKKALERSI
ncbi:MAG: glycosyltransferase family 4 protein [Candidatus Bathyarchaeota archaeon]|nr:glycosyltransferase family 4 protein [Candidatus Bathyarchaeota archaeon]